MAVKILHKSSPTAGKTPAASDLNLREISINTADGLLHIKNAAGQVITVNPTPQSTWFSNTLYPGPQLVNFTATGTTDSNGRVIFNITKDGTASGAAVFSNVFTRIAQSYSSATQSNNCPFCVIESFTAKSVSVRLIMGVTTLIVANTTTFAGAGFRVDLFMTGAL